MIVRVYPGGGVRRADRSDRAAASRGTSLRGPRRLAVACFRGVPDDEEAQLSRKPVRRRRSRLAAGRAARTAGRVSHAVSFAAARLLHAGFIAEHRARRVRAIALSVRCHITVKTFLNRTLSQNCFGGLAISALLCRPAN
jgi:hypothetical protein